MSYPGNIRAAALGDVLAWCAKAPLADVLASLKQLRDETGLPVPVLAAIVGGLQGPDAPGATIVGNPIVIAGSAPGGLVKSLFVDATGAPVVRPGADDAGNSRSLLTDRIGLTAVAPPVSKLWFQAASYTNPGIPTITQPAPGVGNRNVVLAWGWGLACGANAQAPILISFNAGPQMFAACPANDFRGYAADGPLIGGSNSSIAISCSVAPAVAANLALWMVGYVAAFP